MRRLFCTCLMAAILAPWSVEAAAPTGAKPPLPKPGATTPMAEQEEFFEKHVRPMLVQNCISCHGPDLQEGGIRLDSRDFMVKPGEGAPVVLPGNPDRSRLISVTRYDGDVQMPPDGKLPEKELTALVTWVRMGAPWTEAAVAASSISSDKPAAAKPNPMEARFAESRSNHWAFQPVKRPALPKVSDPKWCATPVDNFVLAQLDASKLQPSPPADRRTLIRRLTYDLTGLPPTIAEVDAFLKDTSPTAVATVVDRLLASPAYGERWGRHWLDLARYGDTKGYVFTEERRYPYSYTYRDYVIRAFNDDLPYDRFLMEQLAADQLPPTEDNRALAGLGFLTVGRRFGNNQQDIFDDRIDVTTRGLMGLTVACARCHDHKYDPIPTEDYYSLYGVFASCSEPKELPLVGKPADTPGYRAYVAELATRQQAYDDFMAKNIAELEEEFRTHVGDYLARIVIDKLDKSLNKQDYEFVFHRGEPRPQVVRRWREYIQRAGSKHPVFALWYRFDDLNDHHFEAEALKVVEQLKAPPNPKAPRVNRMVQDALVKDPPKTMLDVVRVYDQLFTAVAGEWLKLTKPATAGQSGKDAKPVEPPTKLADPVAEELRLVLFGPGSPAVFNYAQGMFLFDRDTRDQSLKLLNKVEEFKVTSADAPPRAMVLEDNPKPSRAVVLIRGNAGRPGKEVPRQMLQIVAGDQRKPFQQGSGRLELAQAIVGRDNPLTARVLVNRVWLQHFGTGLVRTPSDFGVRSEPPSHPELLDYLTSTFVEEGWSIKKLHRTMVLSSTYAQASHDRPEARQVDPENRWLWRMNRRRLELEALRDSILVAAGRLDRTVGGRPVELTKPPFTTRRTVYGMIDRQDLPELFRVFDFADPDVSTDQRTNTTVPQQALFVMNSAFILEQAAHLAARKDVVAAGKPAERVRALYRDVLARDPSADEIALGEQFLELQAKAEKPPVQKPAPANPKTAKPAKGKGNAKPPVVPLSPTAMYGQVLLLTNEFMFVD
jgi:mono/diheme cytochrome c family protein